MSNKKPFEDIFKVITRIINVIIFGAMGKTVLLVESRPQSHKNKSIELSNFYRDVA